MTAFTMVTTVSALCFMFVWTIILLSYLAFRARRPHLHDASIFKMPGGKFMPYVVLAFFVFILWALTTQADTLTAMVVTPIWFLLLGIGYMFVRRNPKHASLRSAHAAKVAEERYEAAAYRDAMAFNIRGMKDAREDSKEPVA